jgi:hypothetical protein
MAINDNRGNLDGGGRGGGMGSPGLPAPAPAKGKNPGGSPGLLTSTGGLFGLTGALFAPFLNTDSDTNYALLFDPSDFNCEEDAFYDFKVEDVNVGCSCTIHKLVVIYRNIGLVEVTFGVRVYQPLAVGNKKFVTAKQTKVIGTKKPNFKLYTENFNVEASGERPQAFMFRKANKGPLSVVSVVMVGDAQEVKLL